MIKRKKHGELIELIATWREKATRLRGMVVDGEAGRFGARVIAKASTYDACACDLEQALCQMEGHDDRD